MIYKIGSSGKEVSQIQSKLGLSADGIFGKGTAAAVKEWQAANGLSADGIVGPGTWDKMFAEPEVVVEDYKDLKLSKLQGHVPAKVLLQVPNTADTFQINTPLRLAHFLAQCGHESAGFKAVSENLNYSAKALGSIFKKYFPTEELALQYERKPELIANKVYASRMSNGDEASGDGFKFRGRGYIQLTGRANYTAFGKAINEDIPGNPDKVASDYPLLSAAWFWSSNGLNQLADKGSSDAEVTAITKRVNGGTIGLEDRIKHFKEYYHLLV